MTPEERDQREAREGREEVARTVREDLAEELAGEQREERRVREGVASDVREDLATKVASKVRGELLLVAAFLLGILAFTWYLNDDQSRDLNAVIYAACLRDNEVRAELNDRAEVDRATLKSSIQVRLGFLRDPGTTEGQRAALGEAIAADRASLGLIHDLEFASCG